MFAPESSPFDPLKSHLLMFLLHPEDSSELSFYLAYTNVAVKAYTKFTGKGDVTISTANVVQQDSHFDHFASFEWSDITHSFQLKFFNFETVGRKVRGLPLYGHHFELGPRRRETMPAAFAHDQQGAFDVANPERRRHHDVGDRVIALRNCGLGLDTGEEHTYHGAKVLGYDPLRSMYELEYDSGARDMTVPFDCVKSTEGGGGVAGGGGGSGGGGCGGGGGGTSAGFMDGAGFSVRISIQYIIVRCIYVIYYLKVVIFLICSRCYLGVTTHPPHYS